VDNAFTPLDNDKRKMLLRMATDVKKCIESTAEMVESMAFEHYDVIRNHLCKEGTLIFTERKNEMMKTNSEYIRAEILYLTILYESWALLDSIKSFVKASKKFLTSKEQPLQVTP
jgi:hypothetical protein